MFPSKDDELFKMALSHFHKHMALKIDDQLSEFAQLAEKEEEIHLSTGNIDSLIDLALATGDKEWFMELTNKRAAMAH